MKKAYIFLLTLVCTLLSNAQEWSLKLSSNVELRTWRLSTKPEKDEKSVQGALIVLYKGENRISETTSDLNGDFVINIPATGEFILKISYGSCNIKKFYVSTNGIPEKVGKDNYKPTVTIGGFIMSEPIPGVDYIGLSEPLVKVEYKSGGQNFDKDDAVTNKGINIISNINNAENIIIDKFCNNNKLGDEAMKKKRCPQAKEYYLKAMSLLPKESYPIEQLKKAENCIEDKKADDEMAAALTAKKAETAKLALDKTIKEKNDKNNASFKRPTVEKPTSEKIVNDVKAKPVAEKKVMTEKKSSPSSNSTIVKSKRTTPALLNPDKYKELICKGDAFFRKKQYKEAKTEYMGALQISADDPYAKAKLSQCEQMLTPKS